MKTFQQRVIESRDYTVLYTVEAKNAEEAADKMESGDTIEEVEEKCEGVQNRTPYDDLVEVKRKGRK